ncbi:probably inactive receptor-like protein kinase At5g41680 [Salvia miltiorrhiza]|uniref:probably inactive receptor-like protein kinase At5g41680 n=1 Tax=Salvia miltiorrhiza TaxID=226208 RepID=UPI0025AD2F64|nr:probably inactive receptor-like protein kinase At5g41680 [Salvia miltiorrhiza]
MAAVRLTAAVGWSRELGCDNCATGTKAVIKLLNTVKITEDEFEQHMIVLGNCVHENVATPRAHRFSEMTKLIVYDYYSQGSVFDMLHGGNTNGNRPNWERRVRIAAGAAQGIAHIHTQCGGKLAHGNIKSSNIFVNSQGYGCVCDFGLAGLPGMAAKWWDALEYYTSEHSFKSPSQESDVYSFGMFLVELVTGKLPVLLPYLVNLLCTSEPDTLDFNVFKPSLFADELGSVEMEVGKFPADSDLNSWCVEELRRTLVLAKWCLALLPQDRPTMSQVVIQLQSMIRFGSGDERGHHHPRQEASLE